MLYVIVHIVFVFIAIVWLSLYQNISRWLSFAALSFGCMLINCVHS